MESHSKAAFALDTIAALAKVQFGQETEIAEIVPLTAGWFNSAYAIRFSNLEPDAVLRIAPRPEQPVLTYEPASATWNWEPTYPQRPEPRPLQAREA